MTTTKTELVEIKPIEMKTMEIEIIGDTPLIMHAWSEKAKRMMLETQKGQTKGKKKPVRNPVDDFIQSLYWLTEKPVYKEDASEEECEIAFNEAISKGAKFGFPVTAFKQAGNSAALRMGWVKNQTGLRGAYFIGSEFGDMVEIVSDAPIMREDMVKVGMGTADLRYRGEFRNWRAKFKVKVNTSGMFSIENILNVINAGGSVCGVGEWRPEKDGQFGMYHIKTE